MAKGKLILICQSGGEFITQGDGTLSYEGGEANAVNINHDTLFDDLKLKLAEMSNLDQKTISLKYFLPGNRRNLITLRNDKDLKRMIDFHGNSVTADIFVDGKEGFDHDAIKVDASRDGGMKLAETVKHVSDPPTDNLNNDADKNADISSPSQESTDSPQSSEDGGSENDFEYKPRLTAVNLDGSPADTVKKRRRTASWKVGAHGPTIVAVSDNNDGERRRRRRRKSDLGSTNNNNNLDEIQQQDDDDDDLPDESLVASWRDCITGVGQDFKSVKEFRESLQKYSIAHRFGFKLKKNDSNRASGICVEDGCSWSIHASWVPASHSFRIKKFNDSHTCGGESWKNAHPAKKLLVRLIRKKLVDSPHPKTKEIGKSISRDFGIELKYTQLRRGIEVAREQLQGSYKESYNRLPYFCQKLEVTNPGSSVKLKTDDEKKFQSLFVSLHSRIHSFQNYCRPILFLNSTSLKSKYQESLLTATAVDADDGFFPVAFAIVDTETADSWHWFLEQLKPTISTSQPLTFVSDSEKGLKKPVQELFENSYHGYSMFHLIESFKRNLKGPFNGEGRGVLPGKILAAAHSVRLSGFKKFTEQIKQISPNAYDWLIQIEPENYTSLSFRGEPYNYIVQNVAETYGKIIDEVRECPIMQKIEALINAINEEIKIRLEESGKWNNTKLAPSKEKRLNEEALKAQGLRVFISSDVLFEVHDDSTHVVNVEKLECTCLEWKQDNIPCRHAIAAFNSSGRSVYQYCSRKFTAENYRSTYSESINPVVGVGAPSWKEENDGNSSSGDDVKVFPPAARQQTKKEQNKIEDPDKRTVTCSKCKEPGHNKASCKADL